MLFSLYQSILFPISCAIPTIGNQIICCIAKEDKAPIYLFSQTDITNDSDGNDIIIYDGMEVSVFDYDYDDENMPDALLADGIIVRNFLDQYPNVKWLIRLVKHKKNYKSGDEYVYWMSDL